jgi:hypothetical protein
MMVETLKAWIRRHPILEAASYVVQNTALPHVVNFSGTSLRGRTLAQGVEYVHTVGLRYRAAAQRLGRSFAGARVLEIGPGDNLGTAVCLVAWGAQQVVSIDRFNCLGRWHREREIYRALVGRFTEEQRQRVLSACPWIESPEAPIEGVVAYRTGRPLEEAGRLLEWQGFECVVSNAVLEHLSDVGEAFEALRPHLARDAWMFHEVDLRCHGRFEVWSPLYFLTIPGWLWRLMGSRLGIPNRLRLPAYHGVFERMGFGGQEEILEHAEESDIAAVFPRVVASLGVRHPNDLRPLVVRFYLEEGKKGIANT